jgi:DNA repair protein RadD
MTFELRDYQREAVDGLYNYWAGKAGENPLIVAPTGSGKTAIIAQIVKDAMGFTGTRVLDFGARQGAFGAGCGWIEAIIPRS